MWYLWAAAHGTGPEQTAHLQKVLSKAASAIPDCVMLSLALADSYEAEKRQPEAQAVYDVRLSLLAPTPFILPHRACCHSRARRAPLAYPAYSVPRAPSAPVRVAAATCCEQLGMQGLINKVEGDPTFSVEAGSAVWMQNMLFQQRNAAGAKNAQQATRKVFVQVCPAHLSRLCACTLGRFRRGGATVSTAA